MEVERCLGLKYNVLSFATTPLGCALFVAYVCLMVFALGGVFRTEHVPAPGANETGSGIGMHALTIFSGPWAKAVALLATTLVPALFKLLAVPQSTRITTEASKANFDTKLGYMEHCKRDLEHVSAVLNYGERWWVHFLPTRRIPFLRRIFHGAKPSKWALRIRRIMNMGFDFDKRGTPMRFMV